MQHFYTDRGLLSLQMLLPPQRKYSSGHPDLNRSRHPKQRSVPRRIRRASLPPGRGWAGSSPPRSEPFPGSSAGSRGPPRSRYWGQSSGPGLRGHKTCTGGANVWSLRLLFRICRCFFSTVPSISGDLLFVSPKGYFAFGLNKSSRSLSV